MQLTKFDRWIRERYIYRTHIYAMRMPDAPLPSDILVEELEDMDYIRNLGNGKYDIVWEKVEL